MDQEFSFRTRKEDIDRISDQDCEVLIIGGGITGAGVASILAENGVNAVLVEKSDFASGTSSGSSKLIHGGLRYLAQGHFRVVRELLKERDYLMSHTDIVKPLRFHIIVDRYSWKKYTLRLGLFLYNILDGKFKIPKYTLNDGRYPSSVKGYFDYIDAYTDDSSLVIYNIVSARRRGVICLNYVEATDFQLSVASTLVTLRDAVTRTDFSLKPRVIVNAAGPWAGDLMGRLGSGLESPFRLSRGIHLVIPRTKIPVSEAIAFRSAIDRRQMFIIPRGEVVHVGTTDTFVEDPDDFSIPADDVEYVMKNVASLFPTVTREDVITSFAGLRPLFGEGDDPGKISRDFEIRMQGNVVNVLGGKITNYRVAARKVAQKVSTLLGRRINTKGLPRIDYKRPQDGRVKHEIFNECPLTLEDIMRRREAYRIYEPDCGESKEAEVQEEMTKAGMVA